MSDPDEDDFEDVSGIEDLIVRQKTRPGASPGTLIVDPEAPKPKLRVIGYGEDGVEEQELAAPGQMAAWLGKRPVVWFHVAGLGDEAVLRGVADQLRIHRLALEDVVNVHQRPKVEEYDEHLFVIVRFAERDVVLQTEQVSLFLGRGFLLTFREQVTGLLEPIRDRIRKGVGKMRQCGPDYLAYAVLDAITDAGYPLLEALGDQLQELEEEVLGDPRSDIVKRIHQVRRELVLLRRTVWPLRDVFSQLMRGGSKYVQDQTIVYLRDCQDHVSQIIDIVESYREIAAGLAEAYRSSVGHKMNEIMKVLTIIATIFIPLTFIAGIYGMNFDPESSPWNMPELSAYLGYPLCLAAMLLTGAAMVWFFRKRGWLG